MCSANADIVATRFYKMFWVIKKTRILLLWNDSRNDISLPLRLVCQSLIMSYMQQVLWLTVIFYLSVPNMNIVLNKSAFVYMHLSVHLCFSQKSYYLVDIDGSSAISIQEVLFQKHMYFISEFHILNFTTLFLVNRDFSLIACIIIQSDRFFIFTPHFLLLQQCQTFLRHFVGDRK